MYVPAVRGQKRPKGQIKKKLILPLSLWLFVVNFRKAAFNSDCIWIFHDLIHVYSPRAGTINSRG